MIAFFDSNIHISLLLGHVSLDEVLQHIGAVPVRLSPVVASELLRGVSGGARRAAEKLVEQLLPIEPPSWRNCWYEAGRLLPRIFPNHEEIGLARLQNDLLLALTSRHTGALFVTTDGHFAALRRYVSFALKTMGSVVD
jgi:predicted nucleic acid-binding protein